jgi:hypothetical protein
VIRHAISLHARFTWSYRYVEELLTERSFDVSYETLQRWVLKFGPAFAGCGPGLPIPGTWTRRSSQSGLGACIRLLTDAREDRLTIPCRELDRSSEPRAVSPRL